MTARLKQILHLPPLAPQDWPPAAHLLRSIQLTILGAAALLAALTALDLPHAAPALWLELFLLASAGISLALAVSGRQRPAGIALAAGIWLVFTAAALWFENALPLSLGGYLVGILAISLLYGNRSGFLYFAACLIGSAGSFAGRALGLPPVFTFSGSMLYNWLAAASVFSMIAMLISLAFRSLQLALAAARQAQRHAERRAVQLQVAAEVASEATAVQHLEDLLERAVYLVGTRFDFYHAGIFLNAEDGFYTVLKAATGEAGRRMLASGYRLRLEGTGIVAHVAARGEPRFAPDVGQDQVHLKNPLLPETRSEMALPLKAGAHMIGVLDVQSKLENAFDADDLGLLQTLADQLATAIQTARLLEATRRQMQELQALNTIALAAAETTSESIIIQTATRLIGETLHPDNYGLLVFDDKLGRLVSHPSYRQQNGSPRPASPPDTGFPGLAVQSGQIVRVDNVAQEPHESPHDPLVCSVLCAPVKLQDQIQGVLNVESRRPFAFSAADERLLASLAGQLATAMQKMRLFEQSRQQVLDLEQLLSASEAVSTSLHLPAVLEITLQNLASALGAERGVVSLLDNGNEGYLRQQAYDARSADRFTPLSPPQPRAELVVLQQVLAQRTPLVLSAAGEGLSGEQAGWLAGRGCQSLLILPLIARDRVLGAVEILHDQEGRAYTRRQIDLCQTMANQMAVAVENARLFEAERKRRLELEALRQASLRLTSSLEWKPVLQSILEQALRLIPADFAHIFLFNGQSLSFGASLWSVEAAPGSQPLPDLEPLSLAVARSGERLVFPDETNPPDAPAPAWQSALIGLPLRVGNQVHGVMNVVFRQPYHFSPDEIGILELLGDQAALALENARLFASARQRAKELAQANERLQELDRLKNTFIQNVSHELRTPLTIVRGYAELLESGELGNLETAQEEPVKIIARRTRMLTKLVSDLTAILETEANLRKEENLDFPRLVESMLADFKNALRQAGLQLEANLDPQLPLLRGDGSHLRRIVDNLINNAMKFTPSGGKIRVTVCQQKDSLLLEVADSGIGIPPDKLEHIFERFYQVDSSATRRYGGTGLGLALVKEIAQAHGGSVQVESKIGQGSVFRVYLPIRAAGGSPAGQSPAGQAAEERL